MNIHLYSARWQLALIGGGCLLTAVTVVPAKAADGNPPAPANTPTTNNLPAHNTPKPPPPVTSEGARPSNSTAPPTAATQPDKTATATTVPGTSATGPPGVWELKVGTELYEGRSNLPGQKRYSDGFWAGLGTAYPSYVYAHSQNNAGSEAKVSLGIGELYGGPAATVRQPLEAWYKTPVGKNNLTVGKFYVPFALQEWEYETKWGAMLDRATGPYTFNLSVNYDEHQHAADGYFRAGRNFSKNVNLGLSFGSGRGVTSGSIQNRGVGLDATITRGAWQFVTENLLYTRHSRQNFNFDFAKLSYQKLGKLKPYLAKYTWHDEVGTLGNFHSTVYGLNYQLTPQLAIEGAFASAPTQTVHWIQIHITAER